MKGTRTPIGVKGSFTVKNLAHFIHSEKPYKLNVYKSKKKTKKKNNIKNKIKIVYISVASLPHFHII